MSRLYIASPAYDGRVHADWIQAVIRERDALRGIGVDVAIDLDARGSWLFRSRNQLAERAIRHEATHMLCWDTDVVPQEQGYVALLLGARVDVIGGAYPKKDESRELCVQTEAPPLPGTGIFEVTRIGTGFLLVSCDALRKLQPRVRTWLAKDGPVPFEHGYFDAGERDGVQTPDDWAFCDRVRDAGMAIHCDARMRFWHLGTKAYG